MDPKIGGPTFSLKIITPQEVSYTGRIFHAKIPVENGFVGVLANHAPFATTSPGGELAIRENEREPEKTFSVGAGLFEVHQNQAVFFTASFTSP